jgi:hypothetical protein
MISFHIEDSDRIERMPDVLSHFGNWSQMSVSVNECGTAPYLSDRNDHRCSLARALQFKGTEIPNLTLAHHEESPIDDGAESRQAHECIKDSRPILTAFTR